MSVNQHEQMVHDFFQEKEREDPAKYNEVCQHSPILSGRQWRRIRERETPLTQALSQALGIESAAEDYDKEE